eukprot:Hpha_TRINITY_DN26280_c0_g1::TRINITY_DN26280_c0_g1_i1::g.184793::m.184793
MTRTSEGDTQRRSVILPHCIPPRTASPSPLRRSVSSTHLESAVHNQVCARTVTALIRQQESDTLDNLVNTPEALHRDSPQFRLRDSVGGVGEVRASRLGVQLVLAVPHKTGPDERGGDGVDPDVVGCEIFRDGHRERDGCRFARHVGRHRRSATKPSNGSGVDDHPAAGLLHRPRNRLKHPKCPGNVDVLHTLEVVHRVVQSHLHGSLVTRVVPEVGDFAEPLLGSGHCVGHRLVTGDVTYHCQRIRSGNRRELRLRFLQWLRDGVQENDVRAALLEINCPGTAEVTTGSRDHHDCPLEARILGGRPGNSKLPRAEVRRGNLQPPCRHSANPPYLVSWLSRLNKVQK